MIGWESVDNSVRYVGFQCINSGQMDIAMAKAPANANIPFTLNLEKPAASQPFAWFMAGTSRA
jgi:DMSO/TMAO reductase YedYZ molybdopterin-dependent catalytic subunit